MEDEIMINDMIRAMISNLHERKYCQTTLIIQNLEQHHLRAFKSVPAYAMCPDYHKDMLYVFHLLQQFEK